MEATAVVLEAPERLGLQRLALIEPTSADAVVAVRWSGVSTGTERLLWSGRMPAFPGMGYPLVPGYESVGEVVEAGAASGLKAGDTVFVPGAACYRDARGLFGASSDTIVTPAARLIRLEPGLGVDAVLMSLAATAYHAIVTGDGTPPDLVVGHGVLGRLIARIAVALGAPAPTVHEINPARLGGEAWTPVAPGDDARRDYRCIHDASGAPDLLDGLIGRIARGGEVVLAGFYEAPLSFSFPPAFMREARIRIAAEFKPADLSGVVRLLESGALSLAGLVTHVRPAADAADAYRTAFTDPACLKMVLDWSNTYD